MLGTPSLQLAEVVTNSMANYFNYTSPRASYVFSEILPYTLFMLQTKHLQRYVSGEKPATTFCVTNNSLSEISGTVSLSFQSTFHLSLTVLVCYRSPVTILPWKKFTSQFEMHSQATLLNHFDPYVWPRLKRTFTLHGLSFQRIQLSHWVRMQLQFILRWFSMRAISSSLAVTEPILVSFFSSP